VAIPAAQAGSVYTPYASRAPPPGALMARPVRGAAGYRYPASSMLIDPMEMCPGCHHAESEDHRCVAGGRYAGAVVRFESSIRSGPSAGFEEVGAVGGAPVGAIGCPESSRR